MSSPPPSIGNDSHALHAHDEHRLSTLSGVSYEEVGFDDDQPAWTEPAPSPAPASFAYGVGMGMGMGTGGGAARAVSESEGASTAYAPSMGRVSRTSTATGLTGLTAGTGTSWGDAVVLGVAVVDFNHLIGPTVEWAYPASLQAAIADDDSLNRLLPFLALPDGAHLSEEDYSYFHCTYTPSDPDASSVPPNQTLFGISCNRQLASADLLRRSSDVTRSMVQKAVVVIASQPVFGPIRDRLGVVTRAFFAQRDFEHTDILEDFYTSLESGLEGKSGEGAIYMGTSLRELVHKFRHKTLVLLKMLMLQKRMMLFGYPVEKLCTYQYSLVSLMPGLLMSLRDSGDPRLDARATRTRPTSLRTSDRASLMRYMGLPLHLFGKDACFQPYLPLQQMDMLKAPTWLVGTTNQIVTQQKECRYDVLVNIDNNTFEFIDAKTERLVALTPADRKWMDEIVKTVEDSYDTVRRFKGSDDDLRARFEEYILAALSAMKYADFVARGKAGDVSIIGTEQTQNSVAPFSDAWAAAFRQTHAYAIWDACTDPVLFDLVEPRHPCADRVNAVSDIGIRLAEGLHDLRLDEQLAPTREALSSAFAAGSSSLFRAFDGVRNEVSSRLEAERARRAASQASPRPAASPAFDALPVLDTPATPRSDVSTPPPRTPGSASTAASTPASASAAAAAADIRATLGQVGSNIGSFFGRGIGSLGRGQANGTGQGALRPMSLSGSTRRGKP
ncbi:hypothetical protein Q5752_000189 [Cryptotrichosporon argae]